MDPQPAKRLGFRRVRRITPDAEIDVSGLSLVSTNTRKLNLSINLDLTESDGDSELKVSGDEKKCIMIPAKELDIKYPTKPNWMITENAESRSGEVYELLNVCHLKVNGKKATAELFPKTTYGIYLVFKFKPGARGFEHLPVHVTVGCPEYSEDNAWKYVYLDSSNHDPPQVRADGWMEVELDEFYNDKGEGEVLVIIEDECNDNWKGGLILECIEFRPKEY